jgi:predicted helicase
MTVVDQLAFSKNALSQYVKKIEKLVESGVANEESFYADFRDLLKDFFKTEEFEVIPVPKAEEKKDKPDFIVYMDSIPIFHIEGKKPYDPVDKWLLAGTTNRLFNQVYRFRGRENNNIPVIVTDFINIWVIDKESPNSKDSDHQTKIKLKIIDDSGTSWKVYSGIKPKLESALYYVCEDIVISISKVSSMIPHLVKYAKKLKEKIIEVFKEPSNPMKNYLENIRNDFLESIFSSDKEKKSQEFADLFAQTLIYGGFIAWMRFCKEGNISSSFSFKKATDYLPYGTFIYSIFAEISVKLSPEIQKTIINKIEKIFQSTNFEKIVENTETLMVTFYSDFLNKYDPEMAKDRGIVYTPYPIVNYMSRGVHYFLKKYFHKEEGIIEEGISFLDPAAGTLAYPIEILRLAKDEFTKKYSKQPGRILNEFNNWVHNSYLPNTYAFEILMAPYVLAHFRLNLVLDDLGAKFDPQKDKANIYLFNTLMSSQTTIQDFRNKSIGEEIVSALRIRKNQEILVIISNPPYNVSSQNKIDWIEEKMDLYKQDLNEKNIKPLSDDYVKFIRFAQWKLCENIKCLKGIIAYITNNTYLDGRIFRIMRKELCKSFDYIYIINLHGNSRKGETGNPFGIRVGVSIVFFIRLEDHSDDKIEIFYKSIDNPIKYEKFNELEKSFELLHFKQLNVTDQNYFVPLVADTETIENYKKFLRIEDIFLNYSIGIQTHHDDFLIHIDSDILIKRLKLFFKEEDEKLKELNIELKLSNTWNPEFTRINSDYDKVKKTIKPVAYRGFDERYLIFDNNFVERGRTSFMDEIKSNNFTICTTKQLMKPPFNHIFITNKPFDGCVLSTKSKEAAYGFPLKFNDKTNIKIPKLKFDVKEDNIFYFIYGILNSKIYQNRYSTLLSKDFPRIPFPENKENFLLMANKGKRLVELHLLEAGDLDTTQFPMSNSSDYKIYYIRRYDKDKDGIQIPDTYDPRTKKIYLKKRTKTQNKSEQDGDSLDAITWIGGITQKMWDFDVGGRQQLKNWLYIRTFSEKVKKNTLQRPLNNDELDYFLKMCDAIKKTIELLPDLDEIYKKIDP